MQISIKVFSYLLSALIFGNSSLKLLIIIVGSLSLLITPSTSTNSYDSFSIFISISVLVYYESSINFDSHNSKIDIDFAILSSIAILLSVVLDF